MPTVTLDEFELDIRIEALDPHRIAGPVMATSNPFSNPCCSHSCPIECQPSLDC